MTLHQLRDWSKAVPADERDAAVRRAVAELFADRDEMHRRVVDEDAFVLGLKTDTEVANGHVAAYAQEVARLRAEADRPAPWDRRDGG